MKQQFGLYSKTAFIRINTGLGKWLVKMLILPKSIDFGPYSSKIVFSSTKDKILFHQSLQIWAIFLKKS